MGPIRVRWLLGGAVFLANVALAIAYSAARPSRANENVSNDAATPYSGIHIEKTAIPMADGVKLAVTLYMPEGAKAGEKFPVILEYLPYRKDDWSTARDYSLHSYFVLRGYASARVDIRGTGASDGIPPEREYSQQEQKDGMEVIAWLARQPWSNGNVGMMGISWGGFNSIQIATRRPPALKAIIAVDATEQLFHDDIHYIDGIMHADEFELGMDQELETTEAPDFPTDEKHLAPRFDSTPWFILYLHHQRDGAFWREPFEQPVYGAIQIPVYLIGGFYDGYRDTIPRFLTRMKTPVRVLIGPWNHTFPHDAEPGPAIEWRASAVRWWDRWLKDEDNGIEKEPAITVYMQHWYAPDPSRKEIPGEWRSENAWPPREMKERALYLVPNHELSDAAPAANSDLLKYVPTAGVEAGFWWGDLTNDQRPVDAFSLVYDSLPLENDAAILGLPRVVLNASASVPLADWIVRLSDVAPDGSTTLITGAGLNGAQRDSASDPKDLEPGRTYPLQIEMHVTSWIFPRGHRIRLAVSNALWPMLWPTPYAMTTTLALGGENPSRLILPTVPVAGVAPPEFPKPGKEPELPGVTGGGDTWPGTFDVTRDEVHHTAHVSWRGASWSGFPWGRIDYHEEIGYDASDEHSDISSISGKADTKVKLKDREIIFSSVLELHSDAQNFYYHYERILRENGRVIRTKKWTDTIPRDHQ
ncbi:MAG: CocE/NonD family hydrolase [Candidatus Acidiferrales bacterium]